MAEPERDWGPEDEQAAAEGRSISLGNQRRVRVTTKKAKTRTVNTKALDDAFDEHYGAAGYESKKEEKNKEES